MLWACALGAKLPVGLEANVTLTSSVSGKRREGADWKLPST
jgi:hypothetical protein